MFDQWYGKKIKIYEKAYSSLTSVDIPFNKGVNVIVGVLTKSFDTWLLIDNKIVINLNEVFAVELAE